MDDFDIVFKRLYEVLGIKKDAELSRLAGVAKNTICTWRKRRAVPYPDICKLAKSKNFSIDYVLGITKNNHSHLYSVLDDLHSLDRRDIYSFLEGMLTECVSHGFKDDAHSQAIKKIFWIINNEMGTDTQLRALLFLYCALKEIQKTKNVPKDSFRRILISGIEDAHSSCPSFSSEIDETWKDKVVFYVQNVIEEREIEPIIKNLDASIRIVEKILPLDYTKQANH